MYALFHTLCFIAILYTHSFFLSISYILILIIYSELLIERMLDFKSDESRFEYYKCVTLSIISVLFVHCLFYYISNNFKYNKIYINKIE